MKNFNAKEILEIAIQNEKNGIEFYSKLSEKAEDPKLKKTLNEFANQERSHVTAIKKLINRFLEEESNLNYYDDPEELLYLQAIADSSLFTDKPTDDNVKEVLNDILAALHYAVGIEVKSIEFYKQVLQVMAPNSGQEVVEEIIEQEKGHVKNLYMMIKNHED
jgi:rubrerythrin